MYGVRLWAVRHARLMEGIYATFERGLMAAAPVLRLVGLDRLEGPVGAVEKAVKTTLFDCKMCGQCILSSTGASCPMNCPKSLRNGPCGGVRQDGMCEVVPEMRCVWVEAWDGSQRMAGGYKIHDVQQPVDHRRFGRSAWVGVLRRGRTLGRRTEHGQAAADGQVMAR